MRPPGEEPAPQPPSAEAIATSERFSGHGLLPIAFYQPDFSALEVARLGSSSAGGPLPGASSLGARLSPLPIASVRRLSISPGGTVVSPAMPRTSLRSSVAPWHNAVIRGFHDRGTRWGIVSTDRQPRALLDDPSARPTRPVSPSDRRSRVSYNPQRACCRWGGLDHHEGFAGLTESLSSLRRPTAPRRSGGALG